MDKKRLDLKFRPDDVFAKPIWGDLKPASGLLIKVVCRRRRHDVPGPSTEEQTDTDGPNIEILGVVRSMFKFEGNICGWKILTNKLMGDLREPRKAVVFLKCQKVWKTKEKPVYLSSH